MLMGLAYDGGDIPNYILIQALKSTWYLFVNRISSVFAGSRFPNCHAHSHSLLFIIVQKKKNSFNFIVVEFS